MRRFNKRGLDTRAINLLLVIPFIILAFVLFNVWFKFSVNAQQIHAIHDNLQQAYVDQGLSTFLYLHGDRLSAVSDSEIGRLLQATPAPYTIYLKGQSPYSKFCARTGTKIKCEIFIVSDYLGSYKATGYIAAPNYLIEVELEANVKT